MITINIKDNTSAGVEVMHGNEPLANVIDITINCETSRTVDILYLATVVNTHNGNSNGKATAQVLKDHGFQVRVLDYTDLDKDGNPFEYLA